MIGARNRDISRRKALRKRRIDREIYYQYYHRDGGAYYDNLHQYSKNKIHCSCPMCSQKTKNKGKHRKSARGYYPSINYKASDLRKLAKVSYVEPAEELDILEKN